MHHIQPAGGTREKLSFADDVLVYRLGKNRQEIADSVQQELDRIEEWCTEMNGMIHPDKATTLWCSLNNHAVKADMPEVSIDGKANLTCIFSSWHADVVGNERADNLAGEADINSNFNIDPATVFQMCQQSAHCQHTSIGILHTLLPEIKGVRSGDGGFR